MFECQQLSGAAGAAGAAAAAAAAEERKNNTLASAELDWGQTRGVRRAMRADCASVRVPVGVRIVLSASERASERAGAELGSH